MVSLWLDAAKHQPGIGRREDVHSTYPIREGERKKKKKKGKRGKKRDLGVGDRARIPHVPGRDGFYRPGRSETEQE